jgi:hypothetical protein
MKMNQETRLKKAGKALILAAVCLMAGLLTQTASASPLNLQLNYYPDLMSDNILVSYKSDTRVFDAFGYAETYKPTSTPSDWQTLSPYDFHISAIINSDGTFNSGALDIFSENSSEHLLQGNLSALGFGYNTGSSDPTMEFLFKDITGTLATDYGALAGVVLGFSGVQFNPTTNVLVSFGNMNSDGFGIGTSDTKAPASSVPEPSTMSLLLFGLLGAGALYKIRAAKLT